MKTRALRSAACAACAGLLAVAASAQTQLSSPVTAAPGDEPIRQVLVNHAAADRLADLSGRVTLEDFPLPRGRSVDLLLERFEVLTPDARVVIGTRDGDAPIPRPEVTLLRGSVADDPQSRVFLAFSDALGASGILQTGGSTIILSSGPAGAGLPTLIADAADFPELPDFARAWECGVGPEHVNPLGLDLGAIGAGGGDTRANPCRIARIAIDSDFEYTSWKFGGDVDASAAYAVTLLGAVSEIYTRDLNVRLVVPYVRVWAEDVDPYQGGNLDLFRAEWNANMGHVQRELAHKLSGNYGGGVAWVSVVCSRTYGYGLSGVNGGFPYPLRDHDHGNWDPFVVAHELGHNFGTLHTHDGYDPPIDGCGNGDCSLAWGGTIMSYCHTCSGGMSNIVLGFHPRVITQISNYLAGACNILSEGRAFAYDDSAVALEDAAVRVDVLANDIALNCSDPTIAFVQSTTQHGGQAAISHGTGQGGRDEILYTPAPGFSGVDRFIYEIATDGGGYAGADAYIQVLPVRPADDLHTSRPGVAADYYALQNPDRLPDFSLLTPYGRSIVQAIDFEASGGYFADSGRYDSVGAVFRSHLFVPQRGLYTLSIESDDGSRLFVGDELLLENDGVHSMTERSGLIGLDAGWHAVRVEYFERGASAGLIARFEGPGVPRQVVPPSNWRTGDCVGDWVPDGNVNTIDFIAFLADWSVRDPSTDLDANGAVNSTDVVRFLNAWVAGCD